MIQVLLAKYLPGSVIDLRNGSTGELRRAAASVLFGVPLVIGGLAWWFGGSFAAPSSLLPGASLITGALLGLLTLMFNRLKDVAAKVRPDVGPDPAYQAYLVFRSVLYTAQVSLSASGILLVMTLVSVDRIERLGVAVAVTLLVHIGIKIAFVLHGLRYQAESVIGNRKHPATR